MYVHLTDEIFDTIDPYVRGKRGVDFGAGDLQATQMVTKRLQPAAILAIDKYPARKPLPPPIVFKRALFRDVTCEDVADYRDFAILFWPNICPFIYDGLKGVLGQFTTVIYCGTNFDGTACGWPNLFEYFLSRELLAHVPDQKNSLLVLGNAQANRRSPTPEEDAGIDRSEIKWEAVWV